MRNRIFVLASVMALIIGATIFAMGQGGALKAHFQHRGDGPPHSPGPEMIDHIARELNLTEAQRAQVKTLMVAAHATVAPLQEKIGDVRKQLELATANGQFDEAQVRSLANQQAQLMAETIVEHERMKSKVYSLLTPEQRTKAEEMLKRHHGHSGGAGPHGPGQAHP
ncbi:MAG: Spy/CpxP family protein refolding chaperone [Pyrinomonadaceae bacterium]|nr:Spy/CpxP family protein refolding chaperone [Pyrinomonadaceae bacterium]